MKKKNLFILIFTLMFCSANYVEAQTTSQKYALKIDKYDLRNDINAFCADDFEGRRIGTEGNKRAAEFIINKFEGFGLKPAINGSYKQFFHEYGERGANVIGIIEGSTYPDEYVIISAHFDGLGIINGEIYTSAEDNASGMSALIEIAEAFSMATQEGNAPKRTIMFVAYDGSKHHLCGSFVFAHSSFFQPLKTKAILHMDMFGRDDCNVNRNDKEYVFLLGNKITPELRNITDKENNSYTRLALEYDFYNNKTVFDLFYPTSDHYNFEHTGVPTIFYCAGINADIQSKNDTADKISIPILRRRAQLVFLTAWRLANL